MIYIFRFVAHFFLLLPCAIVFSSFSNLRLGSIFAVRSFSCYIFHFAFSKLCSLFVWSCHEAMETQGMRPLDGCFAHWLVPSRSWFRYIFIYFILKTDFSFIHIIFFLFFACFPFFSLLFSFRLCVFNLKKNCVMDQYRQFAIHSLRCWPINFVGVWFARVKHFMPEYFAIFVCRVL